MSLSQNVSQWNSLIQHIETVKNIENQISTLDRYSLLKSRVSEAKGYIKTSTKELNDLAKDKDEKEMYDALLNCMTTYDSILDIYTDFALKSEANTLTTEDVEMGYSKIEPLFEEFDKQSELLQKALRDYARSNGITNYII